MTPIPESALDYLVLSKEDANALHEYFKHQYIHYDNEACHTAVDKIGKFVERLEDESSKASRDRVGESRTENEQLRLGGADWNAEVGTILQSGKTEGSTESNEG